MNLKGSNKVDTNRYELEIEVDAQAFEKEVQAIYKKQVKSINIAGFRKGKAPRQVIEKMYGTEVFYEDAMQNLYPEALAEGAKEAGVKIVNDKMDLDVVSVSKDGFIFKATVTVEPEVEIENYLGIEVEAKSTEVTEEILQAEIDKVIDRNSRLVEVTDRPAQDGDSVVIDFDGYVDGVAFEGGKSENYTLSLGSKSFIPGFEEQIVGHNTNDEFSINVTFPEDYQAEDLKGKEAEFKIVLHEIKIKELPEFDDEFVKDVSEKETVDEYKAELTEEVAKRLESEAESDQESQILAKLVELLQAEVPQAMFENAVTDMMKEFDMRMRSQGMDMQTYMQYMGMDESGLRATYMPQAEQRVKLRLALDKIAEKEAIVPTEDEIEEEYATLAEQYKMEVLVVKKAIPADDLAKDIAVDKAMKLVKESAVVK